MLVHVCTSFGGLLAVIPLVVTAIIVCRGTPLLAASRADDAGGVHDRVIDEGEVAELAVLRLHCSNEHKQIGMDRGLGST